MFSKHLNGDYCKKLLATGGIVTLTYVICLQHISILFTFGVIIPLALLILHYCGKSCFVDEFGQVKIAVVKYFTFAMQNVILFAIYFFSDDKWLTLAVNIIYRLNVLMVMIDCYRSRDYIPIIFGLQLLFWPIFPVTKDPHALFLTPTVSYYFIVLYTLWVTSFLMRVGVHGRATVILHGILPIIFHPSMWFSARTFTGINLIWLAYFKPTYKTLIATHAYKNEIKHFYVIFNSTLPIIWVAINLHLVLYAVDWHNLGQLWGIS